MRRLDIPFVQANPVNTPFPSTNKVNQNHTPHSSTSVREDLSSINEGHVPMMGGNTGVVGRTSQVNISSVQGNSLTNIDLQSTTEHIEALFIHQLGAEWQSLPETVQNKLIHWVSLTPGMHHLPFDSIIDFQPSPHSPSILLSLKKLSQQGRLNENLVDSLLNLSSRDLEDKDNLNKNHFEFFYHALAEISNPVAIKQGDRGTCAATICQMMLAIHQPASYIDLIAELAMESSPVFETEPGTFSNDNSNRTPTSRLIQPAFMEYANSDLDYDNVLDQHSDQSSGLSAYNQIDLLGALFENRSWKRLLKTDIHWGPKQISKGYAIEDYSQNWNKIRAKLERGEAIPVSTAWRDGSHAMLLTKLEEDFAYIMNPHGKLEKFKTDDFMSIFLGMLMEDEVQPDSDFSLLDIPATQDWDSYEQIEMKGFLGPANYIRFISPSKLVLDMSANNMLSHLVEAAQLTNEQLQQLDDDIVNGHLTTEKVKKGYRFFMENFDAGKATAEDLLTWTGNTF